MNSLCDLLLAPRDPASRVAIRSGGGDDLGNVIEWGRLCEDVARLCQRLGNEPDGPWILLTEDSYCFAVGLLALWHSGRYAISPPNRQVETLRTLQTRASGVLSDRADWIPEGVCLHPIRAQDEERLSFSLEACDPNNQAIELYTSGTTGGEKPVVKKIYHLQDEITELHSLWGSRCSGTTVFSTASHQHLYGLLFGVLWPLASGQVFHGQHYVDVVSAISDMRRVGDCVLTSVPTHLKRLARYSKVNELIGVCRLVFSSGGPLATETAHSLHHDLGDAPLEILGSTETGGIAWRSQRKGEDSPSWTTFPSVSVAPDPVTGAMRVRSPFVSMGSDDEGYATGDRISLNPHGGFFLEGRIDHVAKIGEKRVDLARMESELHGHEFIEEVALVTVDRDMATRVGAAIVPSDSGWVFLEREGRRAFGLEIRSRLSESWDPIMHPRFWRMVHQLPENSVGKLKRTDLADLFRKPSQVRPSTDLPIVLEEFSGSDFAERSCQVPEDLSCFAGHFPGNPMVPGVLQIDWALDMFAQCFGKVPRISVIESLKFSASLRPGRAVRITVRLRDDRLYLRLWDKDSEFCKGRIRLSPSTRDTGEET